MAIEALLLSQVITITGSTGQVVTKQADGSLALEDAAGGIGGSTGTTDNAILRADGAGGSTLQTSNLFVGDILTSSPHNIVNRVEIGVVGGATNVDLSINAKGEGRVRTENFVFVGKFGTAAEPAICVGLLDTGLRGLNSVSPRIGIVVGGAECVRFSSNVIEIANTSRISWAVLGSAGNVGIVRIADGVLRITENVNIAGPPHGTLQVRRIEFEVLTDATRGSAGTAGRTIFNSDDGNLNIDNGTNWILPDGTVA